MKIVCKRRGVSKEKQLNGIMAYVSKHEPKFTMSDFN